MSDGAHEGILPQDALHTILGRQEPPPEQRLSVAQLRAWIMSAPTDLAVLGSYDDPPRCAAKMILEYWEHHSQDARLDPFALYKSMESSDPALNAALDQLGLSGFQWGWSVNAARRCMDLPPVPNPAIVEIKEEDVR